MQAQIFGHRHEYRGRDRTVPWTVPPQQRLEPRKDADLAVDNRLPVDVKLPLRDRRPDIELQPSPVVPHGCGGRSDRA